MSSTAPSRSITWQGFRVLGVAIRREPGVFWISTLGSLLFGALTVADAWVLGWATNHAVLPAFRDGEIGAGVLVAVVALFVGVAILRAVGIVARRIGAGVMQYRMQAHSRRAVTRQYLALPMAWHHRHPTGQLLSNANSDVEGAWGPIAPLPMAVGTVAMMVIAVAQMLLTDPVMAAVGLLVFPFVVVANVVFQRTSNPLWARSQELRSTVSEIAHESFDGAMVVKTLGRETEETERFGAASRELRDVVVRAGRVQALFDPVLAALPSLGVLLVLVVGAHRVDSGAASAGDVVTITYLLTVVAFPIRSIGWLLGSLPRSVVGYERVRAVLDEQAHTEYGTDRLPDTSTGAHLALEHVAYAHDGAEPVLSDVSFTVEPGRTVALVGATASGKTTLTTLLARLVDPDRGTVRVDGTDLRDLAHGALAETLSVVPQSAFLFDDTVRENVTLGGAFSDDQVWEALSAAQAEEFVKALPEQLDTALGERGTSLSGGQRQRLSLARALVRRPRLLVMDDATSAVDPDVEQRILAALRDSREGRGTSLVVIAHRKATIALADEVVFLAEGTVADRGTHAELLARSPRYADLVNAYENDAARRAVEDPA